MKRKKGHHNTVAALLADCRIILFHLMLAASLRVEALPRLSTPSGLPH